MNTQTTISTQLALLETAKATLKSEFIALDEVIDQVFHLISNWFLYPHLQKRPVIINLWGMTGTGKTSLVNRIVDLLQLNHAYYHFDMGNNSSQVSTIKSHLKALKLNQEKTPAIFCFDEFQYANTLNKEEEEVEKVYSRIIWELLDSGKFQVTSDKLGTVGDIQDAYKNLTFLIHKGLEINNGVISKQTKLYKEVANWKSGGFESRSSTKDNKQFYCSDIVSDLFSILQDEYETIMQMVYHLKTLNHHQTLSFLNHAILKSQARKTIDCSNSVIFIVGNLDEAYDFGAELDADIDADLFHKLSKDITIVKIKEALRYRFRLEQIARLGNNHIIYPCFSKANFEQLISAELIKIAHTFKTSTQTHLAFTQALKDLIYTEGVFPTQGTRPVLSTLQNIIEANVAAFALAASTKNTTKLLVDFDGQQLLLTKYAKANQLIGQPIPVAIHSYMQQVRKTFNDDMQALVAVHEAGHAVAIMQVHQQIPTSIISAVGSDNASGYTVSKPLERQPPTIQQIKLNAAILLSGYVAEYLVFGKSKGSMGSASDIERATKLIASAIRKNGLGAKPYWYDAPCATKNLAVFETDEQNQLVQQWLDEATNLAEQIVQHQLPFVLQLAHYLTYNRLINEQEIKHQQTLGNWNAQPLDFLAQFSFKNHLQLLMDKVQVA